VTECTVAGRAFSISRQGRGRALVLLNGFAATRNDWDPAFLAALADGHDLIRVDHRGIGGSWHDDGPFSISDLASDAAGVIEALALQRPAVLGWSMGGFVALSMAAARPELVGQLILLSTSAGGSQMTLGPAAVQARLRDFTGTPREQASRLIALLFPPERAAAMDAEFGAAVAAARAELRTDVLELQWRAIQDWARHGVAGCPAVACPALIATGSDDIVIPPENSLALAEALPASWLARFSHSGHGFVADHPATLAALITTFLAADNKY
jgi:pimeloyl-ACP methyl ester carboxylesterase